VQFRPHFAFDRLRRRLSDVRDISTTETESNSASEEEDDDHGQGPKTGQSRAEETKTTQKDASDYWRWRGG
jgi:hypothetical protein